MFLIHADVCVCMQAWWMTDTMSTDIWARWILIGGKWSYTEIPGHYPKGPNTHILISAVLINRQQSYKHFE